MHSIVHQGCHYISIHLLHWSWHPRTTWINYISQQASSPITSEDHQAYLTVTRVLWMVTPQVQIQGRWNGWIFTPLFLSPLTPLLLLFISYPSNIETIFDFSDIITKIHPPFQNPGSALAPHNSPVYIFMWHSSHLQHLFIFWGKERDWAKHQLKQL